MRARAEGVSVAIPAAGSGERMGGRSKGLLLLGDDPLLLHALRPLLAHSRVDEVVVALPAGDSDDPPAWLSELAPRVRVVAGGATRMHSVYAALNALPLARTIALVHDGARPFVTGDMVNRCLSVAEAGEGAVVGWPLVDTVKRVDTEGYVVETPDRTRLWHAQTPQAFPGRTLLEAYGQALREGWSATDDAGIFERAGGRVRMVEGAPWNIKVTHPQDLSLARAILAERKGQA